MTDYDDEGEDGTSEGGALAVLGDIDWTRGIHLGAEHCRVRTQFKQPSGARMGCVCGRLAEKCKRHQVQRRANNRFPEGHYLAVVSLKNHVHVRHGRSIARTRTSLQWHHIEWFQMRVPSYSVCKAAAAANYP